MSNIRAYESNTDENKEIESVLKVLDYTKTNKKWFDDKQLIAGYHSATLQGEKLKGQCDSVRRHAKVDYGFTNRIGRLLVFVAIFMCCIGASTAEETDNEKLRMGVRFHKMEIIQSALQAGADPNYTPEGNVSPLWMAMRDKNVKVIELLLNNGADPKKLNRYGVPLLIAASRVRNASQDKSSQVVKLLLRYGVDIEVMDKKKRYTPLKMAATFGTYATLKTLLENGANPNNVPINELPALYALSSNKHCKLDCVELLLAHGANPDLLYKKGRSTYRERAVKSNDRVIIKLIEKYFPVKK